MQKSLLVSWHSSLSQSHYTTDSLDSPDMNVTNDKRTCHEHTQKVAEHIAPLVRLDNAMRKGVGVRV